jgi:uncharacterized protein YjdB
MLEDNAMRNNLLKKCFIVLGLFLFFTIIAPIPVAGNIIVAKASDTQQEQSDIKLNVKRVSIIKDRTYALKVYNITDNHKVTFKSSSDSIAKVSEDGTITGADFGDATITVTVKDGFKTIAALDCEVTVGPPALSVKLTKSEITLSVGRNTTLIAILKPNNTVEEAKFSSNDPSIATVSVGGRITAKSVGETYVFASIDNGKYDLCKVTITEEDLGEQPEQNVQETKEEKKEDKKN